MAIEIELSESVGLGWPIQNSLDRRRRRRGPTRIEPINIKFS